MSLHPMNQEQQYLNAVNSLTTGADENWFNVPTKRKIYLSTSQIVPITFIGFSVMMQDILFNTTLMEPCT